VQPRRAVVCLTIHAASHAAGEIGEDGSVRSKILPSLEAPAVSDITVGGRV